MKIYTRWMISRDLPQVLEIDSNSYENWYTESELVAALRVRFRIGLVAEFDDTIAGYLLYELHQSFLHVSRLAVDPRFRRKYVATQLINRIKSQTLNNKRRNRVVTSVCEYNVPGQLFLRANAFHCFGII